nr:hypothetical chloroplast RF1 [Elaphoglossum yoshinagae]WAU47605.1 hypothetical chloroplast RF1 [Elaphoglossum yoshinagae]
MFLNRTTQIKLPRLWLF